MRQKLLAYLDAYIAHGTTPDNEHLPWRTPVFIDDAGTICAVGTSGHALAEKIASTHRYSFIEDIATDMPEVQAWVAQSGFTLDELGQIQPGYMGPEAVQWRAETVGSSRSTRRFRACEAATGSDGLPQVSPVRMCILRA